MYHSRGNVKALYLLRRMVWPSNIGVVSRINHDVMVSRTFQRKRGFHRLSSFQNSVNKDFSVRKKSTGPRLSNLKQARALVNELIKRLEMPESESQEEQQQLVLEGAKAALHSIIANVDQGYLNPSGKHGKEISKFMELILYAYSQVIHLPDVTLFEDCEEILKTLEQWNLDIRSRHYEYSIIVANREERYKDAANLFLRQIDPEAGYNPVNLSISNPQGLYSIARWAQQENEPVAEHVFNAVLQLSMVSSSDQETYILAAGTALGNAREWESAKKYLETSSMASQLGQPLLASVMQACLLSDRPDEAWKVFENRINNSGTMTSFEWQWGGGRDKMDPLSRDLAMRAMGAKDGMSSMALDYFHQINQEDVSISFEALCGVLQACEQDKDWMGGLSVLYEIIKNDKKPNWIVDGSKLHIGDCFHEDQSLEANNSEEWLNRMGPLISSLMMSCVSTSNFGVALFIVELMDLCIGTQNQVRDTENNGKNQPIEEATISLLSKLDSSGDVLLAAMTSLCGLRCYENAINLFERANVSPNRRIQENGGLPSNLLRVYEYAQAERLRYGTVQNENPWKKAAKETKVLINKIRVFSKAKNAATTEEMDEMYASLATAMKACTYLRQSQLSLILYSWTKERLSNVHLTRVKRLKGHSDNFAMKSDLLYSEVISANGWSNNLLKAIDLFEYLLSSSSDDMEKWRHSCNAGLIALVANGQGDVAFGIFSALDQSALTSEIYVTIGKVLAKEKRWKDLGILYDSAVSKGFLSEELSILAMEAIVSSEVDNRLRALRTIIESTAKNAGMDSEAWLKSNYWHIKKALGFRHARLLMWWNDPKTCDFDELEFSLQEFYECKAENRKHRHEVIRAILYNAKKFAIPEENSSYKMVPRSAIDWSMLLQAVATEMQTSSMRLDHRFIDDMVLAYLAIGLRKECVDFLRDALNNGARVSKRALFRSLEVADQDVSNGLTEDLEMMLSQ